MTNSTLNQKSVVIAVEDITACIVSSTKTGPSICAQLQSSKFSSFAFYYVRPYSGGNNSRQLQAILSRVQTLALLGISLLKMAAIQKFISRINCADYERLVLL